MLDIKATTATSYTVVASPSKYGSLCTRQAVRPSRRSLQATCTIKAHEFELHDIKRTTPVALSRRSVSCFQFGSDKRRYRTIRIREGSEELRQLAQANVLELAKTASSPVEADAKKALPQHQLRLAFMLTPSRLSPVARCL